MPRVPDVFTSWKEIANYLGKSVRTVQRWESRFGLPVQRPDAENTGVLRASRAELDSWIDTHWSQKAADGPSANSELKELRQTVEKLTSQNATLQRQVEQSFRDSAAGSQADSQELKLLIERSKRVLRQTELLQLELAETLDVTKNM